MIQSSLNIKQGFILGQGVYKVCPTLKESNLYLSLTHCAFIMNFMADSFFILQIHHAKSFKMRHITYLYFSYLSIYFLLIQIQVTILLSGTDVRNEIHLRPIHLYLIFEKSSRISKLIFAGY